MADEVKVQSIAGHSEERFLGSDIFESQGRNLPPPKRGGTVREDARDIDVYPKGDVVVAARRRGLRPRPAPTSPWSSATTASAGSPPVAWSCGSTA
jgi:hypothetical protein